ncbi:monoheme cytochrome C [Galbibacter sp.]|jgi:hypothetical protein|uniref:monoheme cytochrome C n=1 Tax=Galbibacter sp. TaxID=2918471 RepID=UPI003A94D9A5
MQSNQFNKQLKLFWNGLCLFVIALIAMGGFAIYYVFYPESSLFKASKPSEEYSEVTDSLTEDTTKAAEIVDGVHLETGFIQDVGMTEVINNCTNCHSAKLVTQNRMSREAWQTTIIWMQETQNLWDLGENESVILDYLAKNYAPESKGRRQNLAIEKWYVLQQ